MISTFTAVFDANVFFGARLRSLIVYLAQSGTFRARWTNQIHDEWIESVLKRRPDLSAAALRKTRQLMDKAVPDCLVSGHEDLVEKLSLPDAKDRHVLAASIRAGAHVIVTFNTKDFPEFTLRNWGLHAKSPDDFILDLENLHPTLLADAVARDFRHYKNPPLRFNDYLDDLRKAGIPKVADYLDRIRIAIGDLK